MDIDININTRTYIYIYIYVYKNARVPMISFSLICSWLEYLAHYFKKLVSTTDVNL